VSLTSINTSPSDAFLDGTSTTGQSRVGHRDSHLVAQGPPPSPSSFAFIVARHLPFPHPYPEAPPQAFAPPYAATPHQVALATSPYTLDALTDARHQHNVL